MARRTNDFQTIRSEGGLLPLDLLRRVLDPKETLPGTLSEDYGLPQGERINDAITQSWNRLSKHWAEFRAAAETLSENEPGTGLTNDKWNLPLLRELDFGLLPTSAGPEIGGRTYAINRFFGSVPVHLVGCGLSLDRRAVGVRGAASVNPHGLVQEFLNRSPGHLWAILSNGLRFRILRDNQALSRQSFLEFDLEAIFAGEVYSDFVLLWLIAHATRFSPRENNRADTCWLEQWTKLADEQGTRALGELRGGVERALQILGEGFVSHPKNTSVRDALRTGQVKLADFHGQLLRVVYRLIFLFVAEDRTLDGEPLLHPRDSSEAAATARERYSAHYSTDRLRELASKIKGSRHGDLWRQFQVLVGALSGNTTFAAVRDQLALPALGSFLWNPATTFALNNAELTNHDFLEALRHLAFTRQGKVLRPVDYKNLGSEEFGGIYESFLALTPQISSDGARFTFAEFAGNERKTSGSYYTHDSLVQCLLDSALDPVVEQAIKGKTGAEAEKAILALKVCDSAVGSGHFLVGGAHRLARHLARVRALAQGESEPSPLLYQTALRDVISHCLYGVDINPMAVELCKVTLWLEALEPGKPLSFLDHHIRCGNSLLGTTPELIAAGLPDDAFNPIEGDDKKVCSALKKRNKQEREAGQQDMLHLMVAEREAEYNSIELRRRSIDEAPEDTIDEVQQKAEQFERLVVSPVYQHAQQVADAWCSAFVWQKQAKAPAEAVTTDTIRRLLLDPKALTPAQRGEIERLSRQYQFFHFHLAFPEVFAQGGFDVSLGNPPWERVALQEKEWFAERRPDIATAANAAGRKKDIASLKVENPELWTEWQNALRQADGEVSLLRNSGRFPLCGRGDVNTYSIFTELNRTLIAENGRVGCIVPTGIATDATTQLFFKELIESRSLVCLYGFENEGKLFEGVDHRVNFCVLVFGKAPMSADAEFSAFLRHPDVLREEDRRYKLSAADIALLNPNTRTCPVFRSTRDAEITKAIYRRVPVFSKDNDPKGDPWRANFRSMFHMSGDSGLFRIRETLETNGWKLDGNVFVRDDARMLPLYEAKMTYHFNHRFGDFALVEPGERAHILPTPGYDLLSRPDYVPMPRYWVDSKEVANRIDDWWCGHWFIGWRDVTDPRSSVRTVVSCIIPRTAVSGKFPILLTKEHPTWFVYAILTSYVFDYVARQKLGGVSLSMFVMRQLPVLLPPVALGPCSWTGGVQVLKDWLLPRVLELTYTAWDLEAFAQDCDWSGPPFRWEDDRRFLLRCELDAAFFHLYLSATSEGAWKPARRADGAAHDETPEQLAELQRHFPTPRDAAAYIMDTFPIVKSKDEKKYNGDYRTKRVILEIYDAMQEAIRTNQSYQTRLDPPPADPRCCHPPREVAVAIPLAEILPFRRVRPDRGDRYKTCVPLLSVKAAAGGFGEDQDVDFDDWVEIKASQPLRKGMFAAQVVGHSMEPVIPDGKYCLFQFKAPQLKNDMIGLFQLHTVEDPELGGRFTVKRLKISTQPDGDEVLRQVATLVPENPAFKPIVVEDEDVKFVAEFLEVLHPLPSGTTDD